jgi:hypothetical protein
MRKLKSTPKSTTKPTLFSLPEKAETYFIGTVTLFFFYIYILSGNVSFGTSTKEIFDAII